jgi:hypothetical protein
MKTVIVRDHDRGGSKSSPLKMLLIADVSVKLVENPAGAPDLGLPSGESV